MRTMRVAITRITRITWLWLLWTATAACAQTLAAGEHILVLGEPPLLTVRARLADSPATTTPLPPRCLSVSLLPLDPHGGAAVDLEWHDAERQSDGSSWVTFTHPAPLRLSRLQMRATLHCGPAYSRLQHLPVGAGADLEDAPAVTAQPDVVSPSAEPRSPQAMPTSGEARTARPPRPPSIPRAPRSVQREAPPPPSQAPPRPALIRADAPPPVVAPMPAVARVDATTTTGAPSASPLADAFVQAWQQDLRGIKDELVPLRHELAAQGLRLSAQEDLRRDGLIGLLTLGAAAGILWRAQRAWRDARLPRVHAWADVAAATASPPAPPEPSEVDKVDNLDGWIGRPHAAERPAMPSDRAGPTSGVDTRASLDETRHQALFDEVDALSGIGRLEAATALLESALDGEIERPPGLLLRLIDLYRRLDQPELLGHVAGELSRLYPVEVPAPQACLRTESPDPEGARRELLARCPALAGPLDGDLRQRLSHALLADRAAVRLGWHDFQTALAWHAELAARAVDQTSTRSMPPALALCT
jgi:hypothetical protein